MSECPSKDVLLALLKGQLPQDVTQGIDQHLVSCSACYSFLAEIRPETATKDAPPRADGMDIPQPGDLVAGKYKVERLLGKGGMGLVLAAHDTVLRRRVAIKLLPPKLIQHEISRQRLLREAQALAVLDHPGIVRIHEAGQTSDDRTFVVMELVTGKSLSAWLRAGSVALAEGVRVLVDVARALGAAHRAGVVHRDIKPDNIMLRDDGRIVVLDFGIAKHRLGESQSQTLTADLTSQGAIVGTPGYMAPEQAEGATIDARTDQFSLAVVAYLVFTGMRPWKGKNMAVLVAQIMRDDPAPPSLVRPGLPRELDLVIARAMAKKPEDRFPTIDAFADALQGILDVATPSKRNLPLDKGPGDEWPSTLSKHGTTPMRTGRRKARTRVAVLGFKNLSARAEDAWLSTALAEMLSTDLAVSSHVQILSADSIARMKRELGLGDMEDMSEGMLARVQQNLGMDVVAYGSFMVIGARDHRKLRLDIRLQDVVSTDMLAMVGQTGSEDDLFEMVARVGERLRDTLAGDATPVTGQVGMRAMLPSSLEVMRLYAEGISQYRNYELMAARQMFEKAIAIEPEHPLAHAALAAVLEKLGYEEKAAQEAKIAFDHSSMLPKEERLVIEGEYYEAIHDWDGAISAYKTLFEFFSDNIEHGLCLINAQIQGGRSTDALETLKALRKLPPPAGVDPRIDIAESKLLNSVGDAKGAQVIAHRAAINAGARGAHLLMAEAWAREAEALCYSGELDRAEQVAREAKRVCDELGDRFGVCQVLSSISVAQHHRGQVIAAMATNVEALDILRSIGAWAEVRHLLCNHAQWTMLTGQLHETNKALTELQSFHLEFREKANEAYTLVIRGNLTLVKGDPLGADQFWTDALAIYGETGNRLMSAWVLFCVGEQRLLLGDLQEARSYHEQGFQLRRELGLHIFTGESQIALANLALEDGNSSEANRLAQLTLSVFQAEKSNDNEAMAHEVIARASLMQGNLTQAFDAMDCAILLGGSSENFEVRQSIAITASRVIGALYPDDPDVVARLEAVLDEATQIGWVPLQLQARLALLELSSLGQAPFTGHDALAALEQEATTLGFGLLARKAAELAQRLSRDRDGDGEANRC